MLLSENPSSFTNISTVDESLSAPVGKDSVDSGYATQMSSSASPAANDAGLVVKSPSNATDATTPPLPPKSKARRTSAAFNPSGLAKSNSTASVGRESIKSHISVPAIGTIPLGALQIHSPNTPSLNTGMEDKGPEVKTEEIRPPSPRCLENGDVFLILDLPGKFLVGLDTLALTADSTGKALGFRDIQPGVHFLWVSEPGAICRCGFWFVTGEEGQVRTKQWDRYNEILGDVASQFEVREQKDALETTYPRLIPYKHNEGISHENDVPPTPPPKDPPRRGSLPVEDNTTDSGLMWRQLTSSLYPRFLDRVTGKKNVQEWLVDTSDSAKGEISFPESSKLLKSVVGSEMNFLFPQDLLDQHRLSLATAPDFSTDTTPRVLTLLNKADASPRTTDADIIGEFQFVFITGMHLGNYTCIEQWWHLLLRVILRAHSLVLCRPTLCRALLQTLLTHLLYSDRYLATGSNDAAAASSSSHSVGEGGGGILDTLPQNRPRLREALTVYKRRLNEDLLGLAANEITADQAAVGHAFLALEAWFWRFGWDLRSDYIHGGEDVADDEDDDLAPVVVELDDSGREAGRISWD